MAFVVLASWKARKGEEAGVREVIRTMTPLSRAEPGCLVYVAQVSTKDPTHFLLYEQYRSAQAYEDHKASAHFQRHVVGTAIPLMEAREVTTWETLD